MDFLESFDELKAELKEKWLDYYEANQDWIEALGIYKDPRDYSKTNHYFLLGVLSVLEPELGEALLFLRRLNSDSRQITQVLGILDLNLKEELEKRAEERVQKAEIVPLLPESEADTDTESSTDPDTEYLN